MVAIKYAEYVLHPKVGILEIINDFFCKVALISLVHTDRSLRLIMCCFLRILLLNLFTCEVEHLQKQGDTQMLEVLGGAVDIGRARKGHLMQVLI